MIVTISQSAPNNLSGNSRNYREGLGGLRDHCARCNDGPMAKAHPRQDNGPQLQSSNHLEL